MKQSKKLNYFLNACIFKEHINDFMRLKICLIKAKYF